MSKSLKYNLACALCAAKIRTTEVRGLRVKVTFLLECLYKKRASCGTVVSKQWLFRAWYGIEILSSTDTHWAV